MTLNSHRSNPLLQLLCLFEPIIFHDAPVEKPDGSIGMTSIPGIVSYDTNRRPFPVQIRQQSHHRLAVVGIQITRRLIRQQNRRLLETLSRIQLLNVSIPTQDGRTLQMRRYTEPEQEHKLILEKLNLTLPPQSPPKIYCDQVNN